MEHAKCHHTIYRYINVVEYVEKLPSQNYIDAQEGQKVGLQYWKVRGTRKPY